MDNYDPVITNMKRFELFSLSSGATGFPFSPLGRNIGILASFQPMGGSGETGHVWFVVGDYLYCRHCGLVMAHTICPIGLYNQTRIELRGR